MISTMVLTPLVTVTIGVAVMGPVTVAVVGAVIGAMTVVVTGTVRELVGVTGVTGIIGT